MKQQFRIVAYVDDFLICDNAKDILESRDFVVDALKRLGWFINIKKSDLIPSFSKPFIGFVADTVTGNDCIVLKVPQKKNTKAKT